MMNFRPQFLAMLISYTFLNGCSGNPIDYKDPTGIPEAPGLLETLQKNKASNLSKPEAGSPAGKADLEQEIQEFEQWRETFHNANELGQFKLWLELKNQSNNFD